LQGFVLIVRGFGGGLNLSQNYPTHADTYWQNAKLPVFHATSLKEKRVEINFIPHVVNGPAGQVPGPVGRSKGRAGRGARPFGDEANT
jgi:hypothetical protein